MPPTAYIDSITPNPAEVGEEVSFTGHGEDSDGSVTGYRWDSSIDGLLNDTAASFTTSSLSEGVHTITFTVYDDDGADSEPVTHVLTVEMPPVANFSADQTIGGVPYTVQFSDLSAGIIEEWLWNFGDGQTSTEINPAHEYTEIGTYTVSLTVTNPYSTDILTKESYIQIVNSLENIYVANAYDSDPSFMWGRVVGVLEGLGATENDGVWTYYNSDKNITYLIREVLTLQGYEQALKEEGSHVIYSGHSNYGLGATFVQSSETGSIHFFDDDLFLNCSTDMVDPDIGGMQFGQPYPNWEPIYKKDGTSAIMAYDFGDPRGNPPYNYFLTYTVPGDPVHYRIERQDGSFIERFPDSGKPAWYSPDGLDPDPMENSEHFITNPSDDFNQCQFTGTWPYDAPGDWHEAVYYMGYNYQYHSPGSGANTATFTLVTKSPGWYAVFATWYPDPTNASNARYTIQHADIGLGEFDTVVVDQRQSEIMNMLGMYYFDEGAYTFEISDDADGRVVADVVILMPLSDPQAVIKAEFSADSSSGTAPHSVQFVDGSTTYIAGNFMPEVAWEWDFGDGTTSGEQNPIHTYAAPGTYTVSLTITVESVNVDTEVKENFIVVDTEAPLHAEFTASGLMGTQKTAIAFNDQSSGNITSWLWDFGDGSISSEQNPVHEYTIMDSFTVTLTVSGPDGSASETEIDFVYNTVGMVPADNTFHTKPHYYRLYSGAILGSAIMDASSVTIPNEELRYSRLFINSCMTEQYFLGKFTRGIVFYTIGGRDMANDPVREYIRNYLLGRSDDEILSAINEVNYIHGYYNFHLLPPSMR